MKKLRTEEDILNDIKRLIFTHFGESGSQGIEVDVKGDKVNIWGTVDTLAEKDFFGQRIRRIDGIRELDNSLTVANDGHIDNKDIERSILERFSHSHDSEITKLGCRVSRGIVTLLGTVETQHIERLAKRIATQVRGVKEVRSEIKLRQIGVDDATLVNRVEDAFVDSPWVNAHEIKTTVRNGLVTLQGLVDSQEELEWAVDTAYQVPGVKAVVSELLTRHRSQDEDLWKTEALVSVFGKHGLNSVQVRAFVQDGIAFLSGEVYSPEDKEIAEKLVQNVEGITGISNGIQVATHSSK